MSDASSKSAALQVVGLDPAKTAQGERELTTLFARLSRESDTVVDALRILKQILAKEFLGLHLWIPVVAEGEPNELRTDNGTYRRLDLFGRGHEGQRLQAVGDIDLSRTIMFTDANERTRQLSLGQDVFLHFLFNAIAKSGPASVFIIDEPENFLHPNLVSRFIRVLNIVLESTHSIAFIATHSPFIVREVGRKQVHVIPIQEADEEIIVSQPRLQTFGANISSISDDIFGDFMGDHLFKQILEKQENSNQSFQVLFERYKDELSLDAMMMLRAAIDAKSDH